MKKIAKEVICRHVEAALAEDIGKGDATTEAVVPQDARASAVMKAREPLVVAGLDFAVAAFRALDNRVRIKRLADEGQKVGRGATLLAVSGRAAALLTAERTALNFVQRLSGIATLTAEYVAAVRGTKARILDTRKTTPGWRHLEKYAVACGGGLNHRLGLDDLILIKDNHLALLGRIHPNPIATAIQQARKRYPHLQVEVETENLDQVCRAVAAGADIILLDNMPLAMLRRAVKLVAGRAKTEASGGITLETVRAVAKTGVDYISVGALTHSARAVDIALDFTD